MPSLRLIQAPVFHGYSFSAWVEFEDTPDMEALESSLSIESIEVRGGDFEPPTNVGQAGQSGIAVGAITPDRNHPEAVWFWFVADNVRLAAENAVAVVRQLDMMHPSRLACLSPAPPSPAAAITSPATAT